MSGLSSTWLRRILLASGFIAAASSAQAVEIGVANYGSSQAGFVYAVALRMGFFKQAGADVSIRSGAGGGNDVRVLLAGENVAYFDTGLIAVVSAIQKGAPLTMVCETLDNSVFAWAVMPDSPIKSLKDLKGKTITYSALQSPSQADDIYMAQKYGYKPDDIKMVASGGFPAGMTLLEHGGVDVAFLTEPGLSMNNGKYRILGTTVDPDVYVHTVSSIGAVRNDYAKAHPDVIRAIIKGYSMGAEYINAHPAESAVVIAKEYQVDTAPVEASIRSALARLKDRGVQSFTTGGFSQEAMDNSIKMARLVDAVDGDVDLKSMIDESYLPDNLKTKK
jgi:NitT/TauT family transport system substrate-binding protein